MMKVATAAAYCDMSQAAFLREVHSGNLPFPVKLGGHDHWHRPSLDADLVRMSGTAEDWRASSPIYNRELG